MDAQVAQRLQISTTWIDSQVIGRKPSGSLRFPADFTKRRRQQVLVSSGLQRSRVSRRERLLGLEVSCSFKNVSAPILESGNRHALLDEGLVLKDISEEIEPYLDGRSIYIVGMMGCGKTTVGKIISQALGYSFRDIDTLVEEDVGTSVADIFKLYGEEFFREKESETLRKVSLLHKLVVSTGGGAVVWPVNWQYMQDGISVWLDVPLEAIARRIAAVGTDSRPLLHNESGDAYKKTFKRLCTLMEERGDAYAKADIRVSLENFAARTGQEDVCDISPTAIAIEALEQIGVILKGVDGNSFSGL